MATYTKTVDPNGGADYTTLSAWEAAQQSLYTSGDIAIADCRRTGAAKNTGIVSISGWTSGVIPKIIVNPAYRHEGKWADQRQDGNYIYTVETDGAATLINAGVTGTVIDGLLIHTINGASNSYGVSSSYAVTVTNCIIKTTTPGSSNRGVLLNNASAVVSNTVSYGFTTGSGIHLTSGKAYNCTVFGCATGVYGGGTSAVVRNCFVGSCTTCISGTFGAGSGTNISSDNTASGLTYKTSYSSYFVDYTNGDFHLKGTTGNGGIFGATGLLGYDLSATFTTDIDGQTRSVWDIGADEYQVTVWSITPSGLASSTALDSNTLQQHNTLTPTALSCSNAMSVSIAQHHILTANGLASLSELSSLWVSLAPNLYVNDLASGGSVEAAGVVQKYVLQVASLSGASLLSLSDTLAPLSIGALNSLTSLGAVVLSQHNSLSPVDLQNASALGDVIYFIGADGVVAVIYALPRSFTARALPRCFQLVACSKSNNLFSEFK